MTQGYFVPAQTIRDEYRRFMMVHEKHKEIIEPSTWQLIGEVVEQLTQNILTEERFILSKEVVRERH